MRHDETGFVFQADFVRAVEIVGDDGFAGGERLRQRARQGLAIGQMRQAVHDADVPRHFGGRHQAGEDHLAVEAEGAGLGLQLAAQRAIADEQQPRAGNVRQIAANAANKSAWPLSLNSRPILPMTKSFSARPSCRRSARSFVGLQERFQVETAENAREHCRLADAGGEIQFRHRRRGTEEMVGDAGGALFGGGENEIGGRALKIAERRAVDVVNDDRNTRAFGGEPAENAGLAAVGVDDARAFVRAGSFPVCGAR